MNRGKKYNIIYADPPWEYFKYKVNSKGAASNYYLTCSLSNLKTLNVPSICQDDCALFLWATFPCLKEAFSLGQAWGFEYKTVAFVWVKLNKNNQTFFFGMGAYTRSNAECVLLFIKGKPLKRQRRDVNQIIISKIGSHSVKPAEARERIVQLYGDLPRVELFARDRKGFFPDFEYQGWDVFGNEANGSINI